LLGLLLAPVLICGYILITSLPKEKLRISLHQGWSLYLRAATVGSVAVTFYFILLVFVFPLLGKWLGHIFDFYLFSERNILSYISNQIIQSHILHFPEGKENKINLEIIAFSIISIIISLCIAFYVREDEQGLLGKKRSKLGLLGIKRLKPNLVSEIFKSTSPVEYLLLIIGERLEEDLYYNTLISDLREEVYKHIKNQDSKENITIDELSNIREDLQHRALQFALITLENGKFYIGLPKIVPPPDEESISSNSILIIPVASGFRQSDHSLDINTYYEFDLSSSSHHDGIAFLTEKILTVSGFSFDNFHRIKELSNNLKNKNKTHTA